MATFWVDYENGNDSNDGLGWRKVAFTLGTGTQPVAGETITGGISGATGKVQSVTGTWATGGNLYLYNQVGTFQAETLSFSGGGGCTIAGNSAISTLKTIQGATAGILNPGDFVNIAKSLDPTNIGNATWTNNSITLTLAAPLTTTIDLCDGATGDWVASANVVESKETTTYIEGTGARKLVIASGFTTGIVVYKNLSVLNLSDKQKITFYVRADITGGTVANTYRFDLCSDDAGTTPVNSFTIPIRLETGRWYPLTYSPDAGAGNLGSAIESIALYTLLDPGAATVYIDDISACTTNGINLQSLASKNTANDPEWWTIKAINGATITLGENQQLGGTAGCLYSGTTETTTTYIRETIKTVPAASSGEQIQSTADSGTLGNLITFSGGWNPVTNLQDGKTFYDGVNGWGFGLYLSAQNYVKIEKIIGVRYYNGLILTSDCNMNEISFEAYGCNLAGFYLGGTAGSNNNNLFYPMIFCCNSSNLYTTGSSVKNILNLINSTGSFYADIYLLQSGQNTLLNSVLKTLGYNIRAGGNYYNNISVENTLFLGSTEISFQSIAVKNSIINSLQHDQIAGNNRRWVAYGVTTLFYTIISDTTIFDVTPSTRVTPGHATIKAEAAIASVAVDSGQTVTCSVKVRESVVGDGTDYNGARIRLIVVKNELLGITTDTVLATATVASEGTFETIQGTTVAVTTTGVLEFKIDCSGTTGWISIDTVVVS